MKEQNSLSSCTMKADTFWCDTRESYSTMMFSVHMRDFVQEEDGCDADKANNL